MSRVPTGASTTTSGLGDLNTNFFAEPQFTILDRGPGQPEFQFYVALNMQFK